MKGENEAWREKGVHSLSSARSQSKLSWAVFLMSRTRGFFIHAGHAGPHWASSHCLY